MGIILATIILLIALGIIFIWKPKIMPVRCGLPEWDGQEFTPDDSRIPASIKARVLENYRPGFQLIFADTKQGGEWWLMNGDQLIGAYWMT